MNKEKTIKNIFTELVSQDVKYVVLRNYDFILTSSLIDDIDLLINSEDFSKAEKIFLNHSFDLYYDSDVDYTYLYNSRPHAHFTNKALDIHFDVVQGLYYRSLDEEQWVPIASIFQERILKNRIKVNGFWGFQPATADEFIHLACHAIYDKKKLSEKYFLRLNDLLIKSDSDSLKNDLKHVFYSYGKFFYEKIEDNIYKDLFQSYISFKDY